MTALDPQARAFLDEANAAGGAPPWEVPLERLRADFDAFIEAPTDHLGPELTDTSRTTTPCAITGPTDGTLAVFHGPRCLGRYAGGAGRLR